MFSICILQTLTEMIGGAREERNGYVAWRGAENGCADLAVAEAILVEGVEDDATRGGCGCWMLYIYACARVLASLLHAWPDTH